jgi:Protein of unknown function (DUF3540)
MTLAQKRIFPTARASPPETQRLVTKSGASVEIVTNGGKEQIEVRDPNAKILIEIDAETGRIVLSALAGDLALAAPNGNIELSAGGSVRVHSHENVELESGDGAERSSLVLGGAVAKLKATALQMAARKVDLGFVETSFAGESLRATIDEAKVGFGRLETVAERLFERARSVFRQVEDLHQLKAGRIRTLVKEGYFVRTGHASIEAEEDMKIDGKQIHLG